MIQLIYCSRVETGFNAKEIQNVLQTANRNNKRLGITGILFVNNNFFLQCLEGSATKVNALYQTISKDKRHNDLYLLKYGQIHKRRFTHWSMGLVNSKKVNQETFFQFMESAEDFDPYQLESDSAEDLLIELMKTANILEYQEAKKQVLHF